MSKARTLSNFISSGSPLADGTISVSEVSGAAPSDSPSFTGNITVSGTVDGRDLAADGSKLDGIESGATADQTGAEIKSLYEAQANTNAYTDAEKSKLAGIEAGATADQTAAEIKTAYESNANTNAFTDAEQSKLDGIESGATADQTASEILTAIKTVDGSASGLDADLLDGQHATAFATAAQGALADSAVQPGDNISTLTNNSGYITGNQTITLSGDVSGSGTTSIVVTVADDSHNHVISNVDGLQAALDGKLSTSGKAADSNLLDGIDSSAFARKDIATRQDFTGSIRVSTNNATGGGIVLADDGDIVDLNDGYASMRFSYGVRIYSANGGGSVRHTLHSNGDFTASGNVTAYSDERLKSNIQTIENAVDTVKALRGVTFEKDGKASLGVIAQEVQKVLPEVVQEGEEYLSVAYGNIVGVLIEAIKEQQKQIDELKAKLDV